MKTLAERLRSAREKAGLKQDELAKLSGVKQPNISMLERGIRSTSSALPQLAKALGVDAYWLATGIDKSFRASVHVLFDAESNAEPARELQPPMRVPVVGTAQLGDNGFGVEIEAPASFGDGFVLYPTRDVHAYALRCRGDSMLPRIKDGEFVVIEPSYSVTSGDEVLVKTTDGRVMVKTLLYVRDGVVHLESTNQSHPNIKLLEADIERMHYVAAICKKPMWIPE